ncbi:hypothetical protein [Sporosarcina sp. FA9]|uniref:hypothetical protein n=1 Tax=Sporosarcina sp. FA9 TaxID=3413030 RepID=UPI003F659B82
MVTKSKNDFAFIWSIIGILIATLSIGYCFSHVIDLVNSGMGRSSQLITQLMWSIKGGV